MNTTSLVIISFAYIFSFAIGFILISFRSSLLKLRKDSIDSEKKEQLTKNPSVYQLLNNIEDITWMIDFFWLSISISLGASIYPLASHFNLLANFPYESISLLALGIIFIQSIIHEIAGRLLEAKNIDEKSHIITWSILIAYKILKPIIWILKFLGVRILGNRWKEVNEEEPRVDPAAHIQALGNPEASLPPDLLKIVQNTIKLPELDVTDVLLPRNQIEFIDINKPFLENIDAIKSSGHTRFPLCDGDIDHCKGILHIKDIFQYQGNLETLDLEKFQHQLIIFEEDTSLTDALKKLMKFRIHMAFVVDEFGSVIGLLTLEDILEELVGNIQDEFDEEDTDIIPVAKNAYKILGSAQIHEVENQLDIELNCNDISTFGGLIITHLGRIPQKNERFQISGLSIKIIDANEKQVISTFVRNLNNTQKINK